MEASNPTDYTYKCMPKRPELLKGTTANGLRALPLRKEIAMDSTSYLLPLASKTRFTECYENLCEHELSCVCIVVPFWLAVK